MGAWSLYFMAKTALYYRHAIALDVWADLAFAVALAWPLPSPTWRRARLAGAIPLAVCLLYWESNLPPPERLLEDLQALRDFRAGYLVELLARVLPWPVALLAVAGAALYWLLASRLRFSALAFAGLALAALLPPPRPPAPEPPASLYVRAGEAPPPAPPRSGPRSAAELNASLAQVLDRDHGKTVQFARAGLPSFDLVLLSVCSLSLDDLDYVHASRDPLLARFDIVFAHFNSAATYSGPALLRLLHGTCGQTLQRELYSGTAPDDCYLFRNLAAAGYRPALLLNHDGRYDHLAEQLRDQGGTGADPLDNRASPVTMTAFDGSPLRSDFDVLARWWRTHRDDELHNALLYNTITLHDGTRVPGLPGNSLQSYAPRLHRLFTDLGRFLDLVEASGRPTVVVLVPEHGAALRGDVLQVPGLRELPTPAITTVPAAVKLVGFAGLAHRAAPDVVDAPASYLTLMALIAGVQASGPAHTSQASLRGLLGALPPVAWFAENENTILLRDGGRDYLRSPAGQWTQLGARGEIP